MKTIKGWITTTFLIAAIAVSATTANAGILVGNISSDQPCTQPTGKIDLDSVTTTFVGILIGNLTGILVGNLTTPPVENCGIIVGN
jgi:hypothetical protein